MRKNSFIVLLIINLWITSSFSLIENTSISFPSLYFEENSIEFADFYGNDEELNSSKKIMDWVVQTLTEHPQIGVEVVGNCDYNELNPEKLSLDRAKKVAELISKLKIAESRITYSSAGIQNLVIQETDLINLNEKEKRAGYQYNRRVDFIIVSREKK